MKIGMRYEGEELVHIANEDGNDYATICGNAVDGDEFSGEVFDAGSKKIDCEKCRNIFLSCKAHRETDFVK